MLEDCDIKSTAYLDGLPNENYHSRETIKDLIADPDGEDIKNDVLKFLEESQNELVCIMMDTGSWDNMGHCDTFRADRGLEEGDSDDCWEAHYNSMPTSYSFNYNSIVQTDACACDDCDSCFASTNDKGGINTAVAIIIAFFVVLVVGLGGYCIYVKKCKPQPPREG